MLAEPQSITVEGTKIDLSRRLTGTDLGQFVSDDALKRLEIRTVKTSTRTKHTMRLAFDKEFADNNGVPATAGGSIAIEINRPKAGFNDAELTGLIKGITAWVVLPDTLPRVLRGEN